MTVTAHHHKGVTHYRKQDAEGFDSIRFTRDRYGFTIRRTLRNADGTWKGGATLYMLTRWEVMEYIADRFALPARA